MLVDQKQREEILADDGNIVISASAGSGKTTIMVRKMKLELENIKDHKTIAAITFTVKATSEIRKKAGNQIEKQFVAMTNDAFIEHEVIRPFIKDALGTEFNGDYTIDYGVKFNKFYQGLETLKSTNVLGTFRDNKENFNFRLALFILEKSIAAQEYLKSKYQTIFIDEYQDSDSDMHRFFMMLKNDLNIKLFIVGDAKQAIYIWRGAMSNIFELLQKEEFNYYELVTNFRCDEEIENFANLFHNPKYVKDLKDIKGNVIFKEFNNFSNFSEFSNFKGFDEFFRNLIGEKKIDISKEITIISNINNDAARIAEQLNEAGYNFVFIPKTPIDDGLPNGYLLKELALFTKNTTYTIYDFIENTNIDERNQTRLEVNKIISDLKKGDTLNYKKIERILSNLAEYLSINISKEETEKFHESVCESKYEMAFTLLDEKHKVMTVFASKGLEFDQVISFARYYNIHNNQNMQNHYVCITRAKEKFVMCLDNEDYFPFVIKKATEKGIEYLSKELVTNRN
ncbi:UvrD-helicase domain-containing protein [Bacillus sp. T3]|uniref:UvrD-helicase domain-containing protein n=1 Tax=Bacillus sp. T3 TaxID=467262 RepID=UPI0029822530|nr:UvrD-helicase domain-containing protein [Bacillus sp. T3]